MYLLTRNSSVVIRATDMAHIPADPANADYAAYLAWLEVGNTPIPVPEPTTEELATAARTKRDGLLAGSDWIVIKSTERGVAIPQVWLDYRQALRDITKQVSFPAEIVWPVSP